jgi:hypothetical protein
MLFARIHPALLLLLMLVPAIASATLEHLAAQNAEKHLRFLVMSINLSTFFAMIFVCWIATLVYVLAPRFRSKFLAFFGLGIAVLFRLWQDNFTLDAVNVIGEIPKLSFISLESPVFVMHVLSSLVMIAILILLGSWLVKKEKALGLATDSTGKTILWFIIFPVGMWFIQPRMRKILDAREAQ